MNKVRWFGLGAVVSGIAASACCIGPLLLAAGAGGLVSLQWLVPYRPVFIALAVGLLGYGFYRTYRRSEAKKCCPPERVRAQKVILWAATLIVAGAVLFPYFIGG